MSVTKLSFILLALSACSPLMRTGQTPAFSPAAASVERAAMIDPPPAFIDYTPPRTGAQMASLWRTEKGTLLGDRRALSKGDILTVVINVDDGAQITNSSDRSRSSQQSLGINGLFGLPQSLDKNLPDGASLDSAVDLNSDSKAKGNGAIRRSEKLELRVAATVVEVLPNGVLSIYGTQQIRVNYELRDLIVTGLVRPSDISRQNQITYDKIAAARISYGGVGQISDMQQPRYGQQILDTVLPF